MAFQTDLSVRRLQPTRLTHLESAWCLTRFLFDPLGTLARCHRERGRLVIIAAPIRWPIKRRSQHSKPFIISGVGADFQAVLHWRFTLCGINWPNVSFLP